MKQIKKVMITMVCLISMLVLMVVDFKPFRMVKAAAPYNAYMFFQMDNYAFRNPWNEKEYGLSSTKINYSSEIGYWTTVLHSVNVDITDTVIQGDNVEYSVKIQGAGWKELSNGYEPVSYFRMLGISTDIPTSLHGVTAKATLIIDGKTIAQNIAAPHKGDDKDYYRFMVCNDYAPNDATDKSLTYDSDHPLTTIPQSSVEIRFTISGVGAVSSTVPVASMPAETKAPVITKPPVSTNKPVTSKSPAATQKPASNSNSKTQKLAKKIELKDEYVTIRVGESYQLLLKNAESLDVKWHSKKKKIARVYLGGTVKGKKIGKTNIIARYKGEKYVCHVTVKKKKKIKYGSISGNISYHYNQYKGYVPDTGARIYAISLKTDQIMGKATVDGNGYYKIPHLPSGKYYVLISSHECNSVKVLNGTQIDNLESRYGSDNIRLNIGGRITYEYCTVYAKEETTVSYNFPYSDF